MMKRFDVSGQVMKKIVRFEDTRTRTWLRWFYAAIVLLGVIAGIFSYVSIQTLSELQAWDLLTLFTQDWEIISDFWQDTVMTIVEELPIEFWLTTFVVFGAAVLIIATKKRRVIIRLKRSQLAKLGGMSKNAHTGKEHI